VADLVKVSQCLFRLEYLDYITRTKVDGFIEYFKKSDIEVYDVHLQLLETKLSKETRTVLIDRWKYKLFTKLDYYLLHFELMRET